MEFWDENKNKFLIYAAVIITALGGYGVYEFVSQRQTTAALALFAQANTDAELQAVTRDFAGTRVAGNAALLLADKLRSEKKYDEAVSTLKEFIEKYPEHPLAAGAWTSLAATYEMQGKSDQALDAYQQVASKYPDAFTTPVAMVAQARIYEEKGKKDEAKRTYQDIVARFPDTVFSRQAMSELRFLK